jgi:hypothetical protein
MALDPKKTAAATSAAKQQAKAGAAEPKTIVQQPVKAVVPDYTQPDPADEAPLVDRGFTDDAEDFVLSGTPKFDASAQLDPRYDADGLPRLTDEDIAKIEAEAKEAVYAERVRLAKEAYLRDAVARERARTRPAERMWQYTVILPLQAEDIKIDGRMYVHGATYEVSQSEVQMLRHMVQKAWQHDREVSGRRDENVYRKPQDRILSGKGMAAVG